MPTHRVPVACGALDAAGDAATAEEAAAAASLDRVSTALPADWAGQVSYRCLHRLVFIHAVNNVKNVLVDE
jgi:hypothetical protein